MSASIPPKFLQKPRFGDDVFQIYPEFFVFLVGWLSPDLYVIRMKFKFLLIVWNRYP